jgi:predicted nucleic acid-binding protein
VVRAAFRLEEEASAVKTLMAKYDDVPMDLADACLVRMAEIHAEPMVVTVDAEFRDVYRRHGRKVIPALLPNGAAKARRK